MNKYAQSISKTMKESPVTAQSDVWKKFNSSQMIRTWRLTWGCWRLYSTGFLGVYCPSLTLPCILGLSTFLSASKGAFFALRLMVGVEDYGLPVFSMDIVSYKTHLIMLSSSYTFPSYKTCYSNRCHNFYSQYQATLNRFFIISYFLFVPTPLTN